MTPTSHSLVAPENEYSQNLTFPVLLPMLKEDQGRCPHLQLTSSQIRSPFLHNGLTLLIVPHPEH